MSAKDNNDLQHEKLRKRLESELSTLNSSAEGVDFDWFLRDDSLDATLPLTGASSSSAAANTLKKTLSNSMNPISPLKSPSMANSPNNKAAPTLSSANKKDDDFLVNLSRSRTADAKLISQISRTPTNSSASAGLHRTATNVETSDIGRSRISRKVYTPPVVKAAPLPPPTTQKKRGFLKKLFGSKSDDPKPEMNIYKTTSHTTSPISRTTSHTTTSPISRTTSHTSHNVLSPISRTASKVDDSSSRSRSNSQTDISSKNLSPPTSSNSTVLSSTNQSSKPARSRASSFNSSSLPPNSSSSKLTDNLDKLTLGDQYKDIDPQLSTYINEIESRTSNFDAYNNNKDPEDDFNFIYSPFGLNSIKYKADEIPPHPSTPKFPSAFALNPRYGGSLEKELFLKQKREREERESSMFGSLLHKTKTNAPETYLFNGMLNESEDTPPFSFEPLKYNPPPPRIDKMPPLKTLNNLKPMKKVAFAATTFVTDPPQQIPSRNPRKGNVEICANGELIIHKIDPQEKINSATGIVVGGSGHLKLINQDPENPNTGNLSIDVPNAAEMTPPMEKASSSMSVMSQSSNDQTIRSEDRILAAKKAREHHTGEDIDIQKEGLTIDKPMIKRKKAMDIPVVTLKMDELYTRCCHLREILPIPATLKQIPKGSTKPIPYLHLRNPRPSMIEILSFTDFTRIAPVICISLDGVSLTREMFRIILSSLLYKNHLEKLSLRNTPIDEEGWKMLCLFLSMNKALRKIDITQCPSLNVNTQRIKKKSKTGTESRMVCNINDRSDRNWALLTASLIYRGGIDDIILTGCKIPDLKLFSNLLNLALVKTNKVGLAYNNLTLQHCYVIARWLESNSDIIGIDLAYNDLSSFLKPFIDYANSENNENNNLRMFSLNSCNLIDCEETHKFFNSLSNLSNLMYLDLSSNSKLMKSFLEKLIVYLPIFHNLSRLNIDNNKLDTISMVRFLECIPLMQNLNYLSITNNEMNDIVAESLCKALKSSNTLYSVAFDKSLVSEELQTKIGLLTMRNVERQLYKRQGEYKNVKKSFVELISSGDMADIGKKIGLTKDMSFTEVLFRTLKSTDIDEAKVQKVLDLVVVIRSNLKNVINDLIASNAKNELSSQGKEMLIRLYSMDASIDKAFELINDKKLNSVKDRVSANITGYDNLINNSFEISGNSLETLIKKMKENPVENMDALRSYILSANDAYDLISMIRHCKQSGITITDLFLKKYNSSPKQNPDNIIHKISEHDIDDDASIDSAEFEEYISEPDEDDSKVSSVYDTILKTILKI